MISLNHVYFTRNGKNILSDVTWDVQKDEHWCILGLNGSGKTTLLNIINGYLWPSSGDVLVLEHKLGETNIPELRKKIGWVSSSLQQNFRNHDTAIEIILSGKFASIGLYEEVNQSDVERALSIMEMLNCYQLRNRKYGELSQGERQRVLIARALLSSPELLILDEPCTGLDLIAREQLLHYIEKIATSKEGPTLLFVTHHVEEILPVFQKTILLRNGAVFTLGNTNEIISEKILSTFYNRNIGIQQKEDRTWLTLK